MALRSPVVQQHIPIHAGGRGTRRPLADYVGALLIAAAAIVPFLDTLRAKFVADDFFALALYQQPQTHVSALRFVIEAIATNARVPTRFYRPLAFATIWAETRLSWQSAWP